MTGWDNIMGRSGMGWMGLSVCLSWSCLSSASSQRNSEFKANALCQSAWATPSCVTQTSPIELVRSAERYTSLRNRES